MGRQIGSKNYNWNKWMDGELHEASKDEDFSCSPQNFRQQLWNHAYQARKKVLVDIYDDDVVFQFFEKGISFNGQKD